jgi:inosine-uridine nucleoside N-ribohydrolase
VTAKRTIIVDTDPGQDDAIALLFALAAGNRLAHQGMCPKAMAAAS